MILSTALCIGLTIAFVSCSKTYDCECLVSHKELNETITVSMGEVEKKCSSITWHDIISHLGYGDERAEPYHTWSCYEK